MKKSSLVAVLAASVVCMGFAGGPAAAQQPPVRTQGMPAVALVDINYIFKKHVRFKAQMEEMKADVERVQADFKRQGDAINKMVERLNDFKPGTLEYKNMEAEIVTQRTKLSTDMQLQKKDFLQREAKIYYNIYQEIMQEVQYFCQANGVSLVINFNGDAINAENPEDVIRGINQKVVYYTRDLDITPLVLKRLSPMPTANSNNAPRPGVYAPK